MKRISLIIALCLLTATVYASGTVRSRIFDGVAVAGGASVESNAIYVGDLQDGDFVIEGSVSSSSPDHAITFSYYRCYKDVDNDGIVTIPPAITINSTAITTTKFSESFNPDYVSYIKIRVENAAGKETATLTNVIVNAHRP